MTASPLSPAGLAPLAAVALAAVLAAPAAASELVLTVPGTPTHVTLQVPEDFSMTYPADGVVFAGTSSTVRLGFGLIKGCDDKFETKDVAMCWVTARIKDPTVVANSFEPVRAKHLVAFTYASYADVDGRRTGIVNTDILFLQAGRWCDLHLWMPVDRDTKLVPMQAAVKSLVMDEDAGGESRPGDGAH